ncbi:CYTH domain-containing protein [Patescibacteria group bacterium]|nr:CYTH domain-containing protein [Patescibacteria group bacterium]MBU1721430.1 CYTH domain-containing protein [Patescibacteria group bacterium]MBU1901577.1 CYTH domain-containing protein [Patescibacteria group bacterium]
MQTEYEASFYPIKPEKIREKLIDIGAKQKRKQYKQTRTVFAFPKGHEMKGAFLRVRDEAGRITMTIKMIAAEEGIERQKEIELVVDDYEQALEFVSTLGATQKSVQETKRELWEYKGVEIMIDWWPFLEPIIEIEGESEAVVCTLAEQLGFNWDDAIFDTIDAVYTKVYGKTNDDINNHTPKIVFDMDNPFI